MKLKLIQAPMLGPASNGRKTGLGLAGGQYKAPETGETKRTDQELLQSWHMVLAEYAPRERAGSQW